MTQARQIAHAGVGAEAARRPRPLTMRVGRAYRLLLAGLSLAAVAGSLWAAMATEYRELATISLFVPLIWAYMTLPGAGMIIAAALLGGVRLVIELIQVWRDTQAWQFEAAMVESALPLALYAALGIVFYAYRRQQRSLVSHLVEAAIHEARHRLASSLTHDFSNLMMVIVGTSDQLLRDPSIQGRQRKDIETISQSGNEAARLVTQLRHTSHAQARQMEDVDFSDLVNQQMELVRKLLPPSIHVVRHSSGHLRVQADRGQVLRVLMNLCINAQEAMPHGGVLTVQTSRRTLRGSDYAVLTVTDSGGGIDPTIVDRLFEPFATTRPDDSTGLGLAIVKSIAAAHGGSVEVTNIPGAGASFSFLIPLTIAD